MCSLLLGDKWALLLSGVLVTSLVACFTYSASITVEPQPRMAAGELNAQARMVVTGVAQSFGMKQSAIDLEGMLRAAKDESSEYEPIVVYRNAPQESVREARRIILVLQQRRDGDGIRVIIRVLQSDEVTQFTEAIEEEIVARLTTTIGSDNVRVQRGKVGPSIYAP